jgi:hypothetical protein
MFPSFDYCKLSTISSHNNGDPSCGILTLENLAFVSLGSCNKVPNYFDGFKEILVSNERCST